MAGVNKVILVGRLGQDPESKHLPSGNQVTNFSLATSESWVKDGESHDKTEWHRVVAFGKLAAICSKYLVKGKEIYIEGKLQTRSWDQDGVKRYSTEIVVNQMQMLGSKGDGQQQQAPTPHNAAKQDGYAPQGQGFGQSQQPLPGGFGGGGEPGGDYGGGNDIPFG